MAERLTIARPYAKAAFAAAQAAGQLATWSRALNAAAAGVADASIQALLGSPRLPREQLAQIFIELVGGEIGETGANFLRVLAENRRLGVLPEIAQAFDALRAEAERTVTATVVSATALDAPARAALVAALKQRLEREVTLECQIDPRLIGGAVIQAGDLVIDGSVRSKLERLGRALAR
jgi:F-type H+-transporting ATPase subunit delta